MSRDGIGRPQSPDPRVASDGQGSAAADGTGASLNGHDLILPAAVPQRSRTRLGSIGRVLFIGKSMSRSRCTGALVDSLRRHGVQVRWRNLVTWRRWFGAQMALRLARLEFRTFRPDTVMVFNTDLPPQLAAEFSQHARLVIWCEEPLVAIEPPLIDYFALADLVCLSNPTRLPLLRERGLDNLAFLMSGFSPRFHRPAPRQEPVRDVAFIGTPGRLGQRAELVAAIARRFRTDVFGLHWNRWPQYCTHVRLNKPIGNRDYARICATSRIVLGTNEVNDDPLYFSNRTFLTLACRAFHLTHYVPRLEDVFRDGEHLAWYRDQDEAIAKIEHWLPRDDERERIAAVGHNEVVQHHQYYHRVARILSWLHTGLPKVEPGTQLHRAASPSVNGRPASPPR